MKVKQQSETFSENKNLITLSKLVSPLKSPNELSEYTTSEVDQIKLNLLTEIVGVFVMRKYPTCEDL